MVTPLEGAGNYVVHIPVPWRVWGCLGIFSLGGVGVGGRRGTLWRGEGTGWTVEAKPPRCNDVDGDVVFSIRLKDLGTFLIKPWKSKDYFWNRPSDPK